jgi:hypothetical protein
VPQESAHQHAAKSSSHLYTPYQTSHPHTTPAGLAEGSEYPTLCHDSLPGTRRCGTQDSCNNSFQ